MSFYNDYRPHRFKDVLGQEESIAILKRQALTGHYHHAYLFFGASGTGKTTTARILAMALNCVDMDGTSDPCGKCLSCEAVIKGNHWDVQEIDAGRFRGLEDIRELVYRAYFSPLGKYKVYIIDECHQLTEPAWNGLLKLLEEPPPHLVIMLCTTQFEKIPDTVISRCQLYPFTKLKPELVREKLERIAQTVGIKPDPKHLQFIVEKCAGQYEDSREHL